ncbi:MAG: N-acetyltransferase family protein [Devosiaceae bacterium]|nr:N-acetyltransferase family protein [Devosiaceae bacterium]
MTSIILRPYSSKDAPALSDIYSHYVENSVVTFDLDAPDSGQIDKKFLAIAQKGHPLIVAQANDEIVGFAYASYYRERPAYRFTCENAIYLSPDHLGKGLGSRLLSELIENSKQFGFKQMVAIITLGTANSIALHKKHGFEILGEFPELGYKFDTWHGIVHMQKKL